MIAYNCRPTGHVVSVESSRVEIHADAEIRTVPRVQRADVPACVPECGGHVGESIATPST